MWPTSEDFPLPSFVFIGLQVYGFLGSALFALIISPCVVDHGPTITMLILKLLIGKQCSHRTLPALLRYQFNDKKSKA